MRLPQSPGAIHDIQQRVQAEVGSFLPVKEVILAQDRGQVMVVCDPTRVNEAPALPTVS
jgi:hypothetical protein